MEFLFTSVVLLGTSILLLWLWLRNNYSYWEKRKIESSRFSYFWGSFKDATLQKEAISISLFDFYKECKSRGLKHLGLYLFWVPIYMPIDVDLIKNIMQVDFQHFVDRGFYVNEDADPLSAHLFALGGKKWKILRTKLTPTFTSGKMKMMFFTLVDCTKGLQKVMDAEIPRPIDIKDILGRFTSDVIVSCAFGINSNSLENPKNEFLEKGKWVFERDFWDNMKDILLFLAPNMMKKLNVKLTPDYVSDFFMGVVKDTVAYREKEGVSRKDFLELLIQLKNKGKLLDDDKLSAEQISELDNVITMEEICAQAFVFFEAGFETSSTTMAFAMYEMAKNKGIQDRVREEIEDVLENHQGKLTYDAIMEMHYLEQVINETLRKYPPLPLLQRVCTKEYQVPGTNIVLEKGLRLLIPILGIQRDPEYYPDPEKFDPERFSEENRKNIRPYTFLPFGDGPRVCIGARFGMMQTKVGLATLLLNYDFEVSEKTTEPITFEPKSFTLSTKGGVWLKCKKIAEVDF